MNLTPDPNDPRTATKGVLGALNFARVIALVTLIGGISGGVMRALTEVLETKPFVFEGLVIAGTAALLGTFVMAVVAYLEWRVTGSTPTESSSTS